MMRLGLSIAMSSLMIWLAQPPANCWWLGPVALTPWIWALPRGALRSGLITGLCVGTVSGVLVASWVFEGVQSVGGPKTVAAFGVALVALFGAGVPWAIFGAAVAFATRFPGWLCVVACSVSAAAVDSLRSVGALGVPWALLGQSQSEATGVAQLAVLGGVPVVSALLAATAASLSVALRCSKDWLLPVSTGCAYLGLLVFGVPVVEIVRPLGNGSEPTFEVLAVQPNIPARDRWQPLAQGSTLDSTAALTRGAIADALPDLVIWPETLLTSPLERDVGLREGLERVVESLGAPLVVGIVRESQAGDLAHYRNSAVWFDPVRGAVAAVDKTHAIPVVESGGGIWSSTWILRLAGLSDVTQRVELGKEQRPLRGNPELVLVFCYEVVFPDLTRQRRTDASRAIVQIANDTWFATEAVARQMTAYGRFRAIEQRLPLIRVAHGGGSAVVDPLGRVLETLPFDQTGALHVDLEPTARASLVEKVALIGVGVGSGLIPLLASAAGRMFV